MKFKKLPQLMLETMTIMKEFNNVPEELSIQTVLGVTNFAVQSRYNVNSIKFGNRPISCYFVGLADTSKAKTTIYNMVKIGLDRFEQGETKRYQKEMEDYQIDLDLYKDEYDRIKRSKDDASTKRNAMLALTKPVPPKGDDYRISKATINGVFSILERQHCCGLHSSEAGEFFNGHAFQDKSSMAKSIEMTAALTSLWDGSVVGNVTGVANVKISNRRFNMAFLLQTSTITNFLSNRAYSEQGFTHRLLISQSPEWNMPELDLEDPERDQQLVQLLEPFHRRIEWLMSRPVKVKEYNNLEVDPDIINMDAEARQLIQEYVRRVTRDTDTKYRMWEGFANRTYEHTIRLAATLAVFEQDTDEVRINMLTSGNKLEVLRNKIIGGTPNVVINAAAAEGAIELMEFYLQNRLNLELGVRGDTNDVTDANMLEEWIINRGDTTLADLTQRSPRWFRDRTRKDREAIINEMISRGGIEKVDIDGGGHRKTTVFRLVSQNAG